MSDAGLRSFRIHPKFRISLEQMTAAVYFALRSISLLLSILPYPINNLIAFAHGRKNR